MSPEPVGRIVTSCTVILFGVPSSRLLRPEVTPETGSRVRPLWHGAVVVIGGGRLPSLAGSSRHEPAGNRRWRGTCAGGKPRGFPVGSWREKRPRAWRNSDFIGFFRVRAVSTRYQKGRGVGRVVGTGQCLGYRVKKSAVRMAIPTAVRPRCSRMWEAS